MTRHATGTKRSLRLRGLLGPLVLAFGLVGIWAGPAAAAGDSGLDQIVSAQNPEPGWSTETIPQSSVNQLDAMKPIWGSYKFAFEGWLAPDHSSVVVLALITENGLSSDTVDNGLAGICPGTAVSPIPGVPNTAQATCTTTGPNGDQLQVDAVVQARGGTFSMALSIGPSPVGNDLLAPMVSQLLVAAPDSTIITPLGFAILLGAGAALLFFLVGLIRGAMAKPSPKVLTVVLLTVLLGLASGLAYALGSLIGRSLFGGRRSRPAAYSGYDPTFAGVSSKGRGAGGGIAGYEPAMGYGPPGYGAPPGYGTPNGYGAAAYPTPGYAADPMAAPSPPGSGYQATGLPVFDAPTPAPAPVVVAPAPASVSFDDLLAGALSAPVPQAAPTVPEESSPPPGPSPEIGWHPEAGDPHAQVYWDGTQWTARMRWDGTAWVDEP